MPVHTPAETEKNTAAKKQLAKSAAKKKILKAEKKPVRAGKRKARPGARKPRASAR